MAYDITGVKVPCQQCDPTLEANLRLQLFNGKASHEALLFQSALYPIDIDLYFKILRSVSILVKVERRGRVASLPTRGFTCLL